MATSQTLDSIPSAFSSYIDHIDSKHNLFVPKSISQQVNLFVCIAVTNQCEPLKISIKLFVVIHFCLFFFLSKIYFLGFADGCRL